MNKVKFNITRKDGKNYSGEGTLFTNELKKELVNDYFVWKKLMKDNKIMALEG